MYSSKICIESFKVRELNKKSLFSLARSRLWIALGPVSVGISKSHSKAEMPKKEGSLSFADQSMRAYACRVSHLAIYSRTLSFIHSEIVRKKNGGTWVFKKKNARFNSNIWNFFIGSWNKDLEIFYSNKQKQTHYRI